MCQEKKEDDFASIQDSVDASIQRLDGVGDVQEFSKKWKCEHTNKLYKHNPEFVLENETYKLFWDFETQTDRPNLGQTTRYSYSQQRKKKNLPNSGHCCSG